MSIELLIPGRGACTLEHLVLDVNGTVASGGRLIEGVPARLAEIGKAWKSDPAR